MRNKIKNNKCCWCGKPTAMEPMQLPDAPILEFMEEKINEFGRDQIWGENGDWSSVDLDSDFEAELLVYDSMLSNISSKIVCIGCLHDDDKLWERYYGDDDSDVSIIFEPDFD